VLAGEAGAQLPRQAFFWSLQLFGVQSPLLTFALGELGGKDSSKAGLQLTCLLSTMYLASPSEALCQRGLDRHWCGLGHADVEIAGAHEEGPAIGRRVGMQGNPGRTVRRRRQKVTRGEA